MKFFRLIPIVVLSMIVYSCSGNKNTFIRDFPSDLLLKQVSEADFSSDDAIIILREISYKVEPTAMMVAGMSLEGISTTHSKIEIIKLLTENAVDEFGTFEYSYSEPWGDLITCGFSAKIRVLKPDGSIEVVPQEKMETIDVLVDEEGTVRRRKAALKIPNLEIGDIIQKETTLTKPFSLSYGRIFFVDTKHPTLFTNLYITLPIEFDASYYSFPEGSMPEPAIEQISKGFGAGETHFWNLSESQKLYGESYSLPMQDRSRHVIFNVDSRGSWVNHRDWETIGESFYNRLDNEYRVSKSDYTELGLKEILDHDSLAWETIDSVYTSIRSNFINDEDDYRYPQFNSIDGLLKRSHATATDMAMLMFTIMEQQGEDVKYFLVRDEREGLVRNEISSLMWFDRFGISVEKGGVKRLYDFDKAIPQKYEFPWFLEKAWGLSVGKNIQMLAKFDNWTDQKVKHDYSEKHQIKLDVENGTVVTELDLTLSGIWASEFRNRYHDLSKPEMEEYLKETLENSTFKEVETLQTSNVNRDALITFNAVGEPQYTTFFDEDMISLSVKNYALRRFLNSIETRFRHNDLNIKRARSLNSSYEIEIPDGYVVNELPKPTIRQVGSALSAVCRFRVEDSKLIITTTIRLNKPMVSRGAFESLYSALLELQNGLEQQIVFEKQG